MARSIVDLAALPASVFDAFNQRVDRRSDTECWPWSGRSMNFVSTGFALLAHRFAWALANGRVPGGMVSQVCGNRRCCNPGHLHENPLMTTDIFIEKARAVHGDRFDYSATKFTGHAVKLTVICTKCRSSRHVLPHNHLHGHSCDFCARTTRAASKTGTTEAFVARSQSRHGDEYDYTESVYTGNQDKIKIRHRVCGLVFEQRAGPHMAGHGCPQCWVSKLATKRKLPQDVWVSRAIKKHGPSAFDYSLVTYVNLETAVTIRCTKCKKTFERSPAGHLRADGCPYCTARAVSKLETAWLDPMEVPVRQYHVRLPDGRRCLTDGFNPATNTVYMFLGSYWHADPRTMPPQDLHPTYKTTNQVVYDRAMGQLTQLRQMGYTVVSTWELDWLLSTDARQAKYLLRVADRKAARTRLRPGQAELFSHAGNP